jgi:iron complex outermembrane receptor protein
MKIRILLISLLIIIVSCVAASAQSSTIRGKIIDSSNSKPIENIIVSLKGSSYQGITNEAGEYEIKNVPYGTYTIEHNAAGFNH